MQDSPFAVLTAVVAPAILTNACSVLCLGTANRLARVVDRTRAVTARLAVIEAGTPEYKLQVSQLQRQEVRGRMLLRAMRSFYAALGSFAGTALLSIVGSVAGAYDKGTAFLAIVVAVLGTGAFAVLALVSGCVLMLRENRLAIQNLTEEVEFAQGR
jgi:hypothetical protein